MTTMTFNIPDTKGLDYSTLYARLDALIKLFVRSIPDEKSEPKDDMSVFDCFSGDWGGDKDAHEIADELHSSHIFNREINF